MWWSLLQKGIMERKQEPERKAGEWIQMLCLEPMVNRQVQHMNMNCKCLFCLCCGFPGRQQPRTHKVVAFDHWANEMKSTMWQKKNTTRRHNNWKNIRQKCAIASRVVCSNKTPSRWGNTEMRTWIHMQGKWLSIRMNYTGWFNNIELFVEVQISGQSHSGSNGCFRRKVEKEDQVIYNCDPIPSNRLIVLLPFLYPTVNTHPRAALTQLLTLDYAFLLPFARNTSLPLFSRFCAWPLSSLVTWHLPPPQVPQDFKTAVAFRLPGKPETITLCLIRRY